MILQRAWILLIVRVGETSSCNFFHARQKTSLNMNMNNKQPLPFWYEFIRFKTQIHFLYLYSFLVKL